MANCAGSFLWYEALTNDVEAAKAFYTEVIGWSTEEWTPEGGGEPYTVLKAGDAPVGGIMKLPEEAKKQGAPPHWLAHIAVEDVEASARKVEELGGKLYAPPFDVPEIGRFAVAADPSGAVFSLYQPTGQIPEPPNEDAAGAFVWNELWSEKPDEAWSFYHPIANIHLWAPIDIDQEALAFSPFADGLGLRPRGFIHALRVAVYPASQAARPTHEPAERLRRVVAEGRGRGPMSTRADQRMGR